MTFELGENGTNLIIEYEKEVLRVYDDGFGFATLGIGHLLTPAEKKTMPIGTKITREQSREYFKKDSKRFVDAVNAAVKVPITQNQFDALVSLAFNIGTGAIAKASLIRKLNNRDYAGAADGFLAWNKVKGKEVKGLTRRRKQERSLFLTPDKTSAVPQKPTNSLTEEVKDTSDTAIQPPIQVEAEIKQPEATGTVIQAGPTPYNEIGLKGTLKNDAKAVLPANFGLQTVSEYVQQTTGWPEWVVAIATKAALVLLLASIGWIIYRIVSYVLHNFRENEKQKLMAMINTDTTRKDLEIK